MAAALEAVYGLHSAFGVRRAAFALIALIGCTEPEDGAPQSKAEPRGPGAPVVRLFGSCGLLADGRVWCFDHGFEERLTGAQTFSANGPFSIFGDESLYATCFAREDGVLRCFGSASEGGLAGAPAPDTCEAPQTFGTKISYACAKQPGVAPGLPNVSEVSSSCALTSDGNVWCWGREGRDGPLFPPTPVAGIDGHARTISAEFDARRVCAILDDGRVACANGGKPGDAAQIQPALEKIVGIGLGLGDGCFVDGAGVVRCYADLSGNEPFPVMIQVPTELRFAQVSSSLYASCAITFDRRLACFRRVGDLAPEILAEEPVLVPDVTDAAEVSVVMDVAYVRRHDGSVLEGDLARMRFRVVAP
jgi:hypothetical protein